MAEYHHGVNIHKDFRWKDYMRSLWDFVDNQQSGDKVLRFVTGNSAKSGGSMVDPSSADLSAGFTTNNDYLIIEPVNAYPGGGRWQLKVLMKNTSGYSATEFTVTISWLGGWVDDSDHFDGAHSFVIDGDRTIQNENMNTNASESRWMFSCSNSDQYTNSAGIQSYTYLRSTTYEAQDDRSYRNSGFYCGGYIPAEPDRDTKPICFLSKRVGTYNNNDYMGEVASNLHQATPGDYAHTAPGGNSTLFLGPPEQTHGHDQYGMNRSGGWVMIPLFLYNYTEKICMGSFGRYTWMKANRDVPDGSKDAAQEYFMARGVAMRWKED